MTSIAHGSLLSRLVWLFKKPLFFLWSHPFFAISLIIWSIVWLSSFEAVFMVSAMASPVLLILFFVLLYNHGKKWVKPLAEVVWAFPIALVLVMGFLAFISFLFSTSTVYRLGMDVQTPQGEISCYSMVEVRNSQNPIRSLRKAYPGELKVRGEAVFCDLGDGKNLIATLVFKNDGHGALTLDLLPQRAYECPQNSNLEKNDGPQRLELCGRYIPILVSYTDVSDPMSIQLISPADISKQFGNGYSLRSIWIEVTDDAYRSIGIEERLPWIAHKSSKGWSMWGDSFRSIGLGGVFKPFKK